MLWFISTVDPAETFKGHHLIHIATNADGTDYKLKAMIDVFKEEIE